MDVKDEHAFGNGFIDHCVGERFRGGPAGALGADPVGLQVPAGDLRELLRRKPVPATGLGAGDEKAVSMAAAEVAVGVAEITRRIPSEQIQAPQDAEPGPQGGGEFRRWRLANIMIQREFDGPFGGFLHARIARFP